jgi:purine-nucleoside phosphorylase
VAAANAARVVRERLAVGAPAMAIVLGSGLGSAANRIANARSLGYAEIPGFVPTTVEGHEGRLIVGELCGREVVAFAGRFHMYEGHAAGVSAFPVRVAHALGARVLFATNAAGGLRPSLRAGDLVLVEDHINLTWQNPLVGRAEPGDQRFPDMSAPYSTRLRDIAMAAARAADVRLATGVYAGLLGPAYETPAEVRMLASLGADITGMSTVAETIVAVALGMEVVAVSLVTNAAAGVGVGPVSHDDVVRAAGRAAKGFGTLVEEFVDRLG